MREIGTCLFHCFNATLRMTTKSERQCSLLNTAWYIIPEVCLYGVVCFYIYNIIHVLVKVGYPPRVVLVQGGVLSGF